MKIDFYSSALIGVVGIMATHEFSGVVSAVALTESAAEDAWDLSNFSMIDS